MSEAEEVAGTLRVAPLASFSECREIARRAMPDESPQVIDNVAEYLFRRSHLEADSRP